ncbi:MAG: flagellar hook-length control protein FliK, partial [Pseudomonadota bacterium]|nr:flagellar hook-length control protein FliK [Pseudomonadota bacterium]
PSPVEPDAHAKARAEAAPLPMPMEPVQRTKAKADASEPITPRSPTVSSAPADAADSETTVAATLDMPRHKKAKPQSSPPPADKPVATTDTPATIAAAKDTQAAAPISAKALPTAAARPTAEDKPEHFEFTAKTDSPHIPQPAQRPSLDAPSFRTLVAEPASTGRTPVADQVAVQIHRAVQGKINNMTVMLEPESLGKIDVRLDFFGDNRVHAHILTDRPETLEMMQRDVRVIERALTNAGLETGSNGLQFSLRDQQNGRQQGFGNQTDQNQSPATSDETTPEPVIYSLRPMDGTRLDIRI